jgi:hypothetical protein
MKLSKVLIREDAKGYANRVWNIEGVDDISCVPVNARMKGVRHGKVVK